MPDQLFTYYLENPLVMVSINSRSWGIMVFRLDIKIWETGTGGTKMGMRKGMSE
jgi:hypothetical protein